MPANAKPDFIGRENELAQFAAQLARPLDAPAPAFILNISGVDGIGKKTLLEKFKTQAQQRKITWVSLPTRFSPITSLLLYLAVDLQKQGWRFNQFMEAAKPFFYGDASKSSLLQGLSGLAGKSLSPLPGGVLLGSLVETLGSSAVEMLQSEAQWKRIKNNMSIEERLTQVFAQELLDQLPSRKLVFAVRALDELDVPTLTWVSDLAENVSQLKQHGLMLVIASQSAIYKDLVWAKIHQSIEDLALNTFSLQETSRYLQMRFGSLDETQIGAVYRKTSGLPGFLSMFNQQDIANPARFDAAQNAVKHFLQPIGSAQEIQMALDTALSRAFNQDVLAALFGSEKSAGFFHKLLQLGYVSQSEETLWQYERVRRDQLLRLNRQSAPKEWGAKQQKLIDYYEREKAQSMREVDSITKGLDTAALQKEILYHRYCQTEKITPLLETIVEETGFNFDAFYGFARVLAQAENDSGLPASSQWMTKVVNGFEDLRHLEKIASENISDPTFDKTKAEQLLDSAQQYLLHRELIVTLAALLNKIENSTKVFAYINYYLGDNSLRENESLQIIEGRITLYGFELKELIAQRQTILRKSIQYLSKTVELLPEHPYGYIALGKNHHKLSEFAEAFKNYQKVLSLPSDSFNRAELIAFMGETAYASGSYESASQAFKFLLEKDPVNDYFRLYLGLCYGKQGNSEQAIAEFTKAIQIDSTNFVYYTSRGGEYARLSKNTEAVEDYLSAALLYPDIGYVLINAACDVSPLTIDENLEQKIIAAIEKIDQMLEGVSLIRLQFFARGLCYFSLLQFNQAIEDFNRAIALEPDYLNSHYYLGCCYQIKNAVYTELNMPEQAADYLGKALACFEQVLKIDPGNMEALYSRGDSYKKLRQYQLAIQDLTLYLRSGQESNHSSALRDRAECYLALGKFPNAIQDLNIAIRLKPKNAKNYFLRGVGWQNLKNYKLAIRDYSEAITLGYKEADVYNNRAACYRAVGAPEKASIDIENSLKISWKEIRDATAELGEILKSIPKRFRK